MIFARPKLYSSKCLGFADCWWNGQRKQSDFIDNVTPFVDFVTHCPEVEIGLGVPRQSVRIVLEGQERRFVQPATGTDLTDKMTEFVDDLSDKLENVDGFVLKAGSPSCSIDRVRYYSGPEKGASVKKYGSGFWGGKVLEKFSGIPIEEDGKLRNPKFREAFLTKIFMVADFRRVRESGRMHELVKYHSRNKYLIMTYGQKYVPQLGRIVANPEKKRFDEVTQDYFEIMKQFMNATPRSTSIINVMTKLYGYFSKLVSKREQDFFLKTIDSYRRGVASLTSIRETIRMWAIRFDEKYVDDQTIFQPFPEELNSICDVQSFKSS
jgi:uncharacterized protein YbgA (DUF1722 family)/uncharacterized protein YbbK (DUF523 family)